MARSPRSHNHRRETREFYNRPQTIQREHDFATLYHNEVLDNRREPFPEDRTLFLGFNRYQQERRGRVYQDNIEEYFLRSYGVGVLECIVLQQPLARNRWCIGHGYAVLTEARHVETVTGIRPPPRVVQLWNHHNMTMRIFRYRA